jgi:aspartate racemase
MSRLQAAGATIGVVPAVTPHLCIDELKALASIPVIDITRAVREAIHARGLSRVAVFGTRFVVESDLFGRLSGVDVVRPRGSEIAFVHDAYSQLAHTAVVSVEHRQRLAALAETLQTRDGVEAVVLAGTDFALMFDARDTPFPHVDCARAHIEAIMRAVDPDGQDARSD